MGKHGFNYTDLQRVSGSQENARVHEHSVSASSGSANKEQFTDSTGKNAEYLHEEIK